MQLLEAIQSRHSVKEFDPNVKIPREQMEEMIRLAMLAPSSINLQPWRLVVVESEQAKQKLSGKLMFNETQLATSAAMILVLADMQHPAYADTIFSQSVEQGVMTQEVKDYYLDFVKTVRATAGDQKLREQGIMDANLMAMQLMLIAKQFGYDTNAIGGFERDNVLKALDIDPTRYVPVMFIAIGKGAKEPRLSSRLPLDYTVSWNDGLGFKQP
ncbi:hypothetical protein BMT54_08560 [Pasteurellaceae bacterium 15-036681]|nr:hypothetical protein BMT54_08560 [Pasteurellaceae bacterium 15-036681]